MYTHFLARSNNRPFGSIAQNGLNFSKSVNDENSLLGRVIKYLRKQEELEIPVTKRMIVEDVMGKTVVEGRVPWNYDYENKCWIHTDKVGSDVLRGYHSTFFRMTVHCGFLKHKRVGNKVYWSVDSGADNLFKS